MKKLIGIVAVLVAVFAGCKKTSNSHDCYFATIKETYLLTHEWTTYTCEYYSDYKLKRITMYASDGSRDTVDYTYSNDTVFSKQYPTFFVASLLFDKINEWGGGAFTGLVYDNTGHLLTDNRVGSNHKSYTWQNEDLIQVAVNGPSDTGNINIDYNSSGVIAKFGSLPALLSPLDGWNYLPYLDIQSLGSYPYCGVPSKNLPKKVTYSGYANTVLDYTYEFDANMVVTKITRTSTNAPNIPHTYVDEFTYTCQ